MPPEVSIVICTRNRVSSLRRAIEAIVRLETAHLWELVIVDNDSSDGTKDFLASLANAFNIELTTTFEAKRGLAAARNRGWRIARGAIIAFTDDDCYVRDDFVDQICTVFAENPNVGFLGGRILLYDKNDIPMTILEEERFLQIMPRQFIATGIVQGANMAFRRSTLERIGGFDETFGAGTRFPCEDIDAVAAAVWSGIPGVYDPHPTVYHHHGRKNERDVENLNRSYAWGRGAYFAKYILKRESRVAYVKAWTMLAWSEVQGILGLRHVSTLRRTRRELAGALFYIFGCRLFS